MGNKIDDGDFPLEEVPVSERKSFFSTMTVLAGFTFFTATMQAGGSLGTAFSLPELLIVTTLGNLLLGSYVAILGYIAYKSGLNSVLMARYAFGNYGSKWTDLLFGITQIGWYAWGTAIIAIAFVKLLGLNEAFTIPLMVFFGLIFCWTAYVGYRGLELLSRITVPVMLILIVISTIVATRDGGGLVKIFNGRPKADMDWNKAITIVFGTFASGGTLATNWSRFSRNARTAVIASLIAFFLGNGLMILFGAYGAIVYQEADIVNVLAMQGLLSFGIFMLLFNIWTTQDNTIYNFSVAGCNLFRSNKRRMITLGGAVLGTLMAIFNIYQFLVPYLILLGTFIPPVGGVLMADFFFVRGRRYPKLIESHLPKFNYSGIMAYILGAGIAYYVSFVPPLMGILTAMVFHLAFSWIGKKISPPSISDTTKLGTNAV